MLPQEHLRFIPYNITEKFQWDSFKNVEDRFACVKKWFILKDIIVNRRPSYGFLKFSECGFVFYGQKKWRSYWIFGSFSPIKCPKRITSKIWEICQSDLRNITRGRYVPKSLTCMVQSLTIPDFRNQES